MLPQSRNLIKGDVPATRLFFFFLNQGAEIEQGYFFLIFIRPREDLTVKHHLGYNFLLLCTLIIYFAVRACPRKPN